MLHAQTILHPQNTGTLTTASFQKLTIDQKGHVWIEGVMTSAKASLLVRLSDGCVYARGATSGMWYRYAGIDGIIDWAPAGTDAANVLAAINKGVTTT